MNTIQDFHSYFVKHPCVSPMLKKEFDEITSQYIVHLRLQAPVKTKNVPDMYKNYKIHELTFTTAGENPAILWTVVNKLIESKTYGIVAYKAVMELTEAGRPHIHCMFVSEPSKFMSKSLVQQTAKLSGYTERFSVSRVKDYDCFKKYIEKDITNEEINNYCREKNVPHFIEKL